MFGASLVEPVGNMKKDNLRKKAHTAAEKKRRDAIRQGYDDLAEIGEFFLVNFLFF